MNLSLTTLEACARAQFAVVDPDTPWRDLSSAARAYWLDVARAGLQATLAGCPVATWGEPVKMPHGAEVRFWLPYADLRGRSVALLSIEDSP